MKRLFRKNQKAGKGMPSAALLSKCRENLRERYVGNFIDKTGGHVFPTRPPFRK